MHRLKDLLGIDRLIGPSFDPTFCSPYTPGALDKYGFRGAGAGMMPPGKSRAFRMVGAQLVASCVLGGVLLVIAWPHAWSALAGGLISALGNGFAAARIFVPYRAQEPEKLVGRFYGAEVGKLVLTGLLFAAAILWIEPLSVGALFGGFLVIQMIPILVALFLE